MVADASNVHATRFHARSAVRANILIHHVTKRAETIEEPVERTERTEESSKRPIDCHGRNDNGRKHGRFPREQRTHDGL